MQPTVPEHALDIEVANHVRIGWAVESRTPSMAVLRAGQRPNHVLHLILTLISCGVWGLAWIFIALTSRERRLSLVQNADGTISRTKH